MNKGCVEKDNDKVVDEVVKKYDSVIDDGALIPDCSGIQPEEANRITTAIPITSTIDAAQNSAISVMVFSFSTAKH